MLVIEVLQSWSGAAVLIRRWRWHRAPALQRRKAAQEAAVWRPAGRSAAGRALARTLPVGSGEPCSPPTSVDLGAQLPAGRAPVGHGRLTGLGAACGDERAAAGYSAVAGRSEEHTSELQSRENLVCRLLLEKKNIRLK